MLAIVINFWKRAKRSHGNETEAKKALGMDGISFDEFLQLLNSGEARSDVPNTYLNYEYDANALRDLQKRVYRKFGAEGLETVARGMLAASGAGVDVASSTRSGTDPLHDGSGEGIPDALVSGREDVLGRFQSCFGLLFFRSWQLRFKNFTQPQNSAS